MPPSNALAGQGTLLKRGVGGTFTTVAEVLDIGGPSLAAGTYDVTSHSSPGAWREFIAGLLDLGEVTFDLNFLPTDSSQSQSTGLIYDFVNRILRSFQIVWPDPGGTTFEFSAFVTGYEPTAPVDGSLGASVTLKGTGEPTLEG